MQVIGSVFKGGGKDGDFGWMLDQPEHARTLFVFNDNEGEFRAHQRGHADGSRCHAGGGNAVIRPLQDQSPPRAAGIPTGRSGGYSSLTPDVRAVIDEAITAIASFVATGSYDRIVYSAKDSSGALGTGIFDVGDDVKAYIVQQLRELASET